MQGPVRGVDEGESPPPRRVVRDWRLVVMVWVLSRPKLTHFDLPPTDDDVTEVDPAQERLRLLPKKDDRAVTEVRRRKKNGSARVVVPPPPMIVCRIVKVGMGFLCFVATPFFL